MPPAQKGPTKEITIADFSKGMYGEFYAGFDATTGLAGAQAAPDGACQVNGTYGCVASASGALVPGPKKTNTVTQAAFSANTTTMTVLALRVVPYVLNTVIGNTSLEHPDAVFVAVYYQTGTLASNQVPVIKVRQYEAYAGAGPPTYDLVTLTAAAGGTQTSFAARYAALDLTRSNTAAPTAAGGTVLAFAVSLQGLTAKTSNGYYPDNAASGVDGIAVIKTWTGDNGTNTPLATLFAHQDRIFGVRAYDNTGVLQNQFGAAGLIYPGAESIVYTNVNDLGNSVVGAATGVTFVNENPTGYGSWVSMNASQLFLVKRNGGAVVVRGDITNPTVTRLPGVPSTGNVCNIGCMTPQGAVYGAQNGVWLWHGGDSATNISQQFGRSWFWGNPSANTQNTTLVATGRFAFSEPYVYTPGNFIYDIHHRSWWRLGQSTDPGYNWYDNGSYGVVVAAAANPDYANTGEILGWWDATQGQNSYTWKSQPLQVSLGRILNFRGHDVVVQGKGTITFTLTGLAEETPVTESITIDSKDRPVTVNLSTAMRAADVVLTIASTATVATDPAPTVIRWRGTYYEEETARLSATNN